MPWFWRATEKSRRNASPVPHSPCVLHNIFPEVDGKTGGDGCSGHRSLAWVWAVTVGLVGAVELDFAVCKSFVASVRWLSEFLMRGCTADANEFASSGCFFLSAPAPVSGEGLACLGGTYIVGPSAPAWPDWLGGLSTWECSFGGKIWDTCDSGGGCRLVSSLGWDFLIDVSENLQVEGSAMIWTSEGINLNSCSGHYEWEMWRTVRWRTMRFPLSNVTYQLRCWCISIYRDSFDFNQGVRRLRSGWNTWLRRRR